MFYKFLVWDYYQLHCSPPPGEIKSFILLLGSSHDVHLYIKSMIWKTGGNGCVLILELIMVYLHHIQDAVISDADKVSFVIDELLT